MIVRVDAQLPPSLPAFMRANLALEAIALRELGLRDAPDAEIFEAARKAGVVIMSKDSDFVDLVQRLGAPPQLVWVTCGNVTNAALRVLLTARWARVNAMLAAGEAVVELG